MKNNHRILRIEKILIEQQAINLDQKRMNRRLDNSIAELKQMQWEYGQAMVKVNEELAKTNKELVTIGKRLDTHLEEEKKFRIDSERRFQVFYSRLVKLEHKNGKNGKK